MGNTVGTACGCICEERHDEHFMDFSLPHAWAEGAGASMKPNAIMAMPLYKHRLDAQSTLHRACAMQSPQAVQEAIAVGRACGVSQAELDDAAAVLVKLRRQRAGDALVSALQEEDPDSLRQAVALADKSGLYNQELEKAMSLVETLDSGSEMERSGSSQIAFREMLVRRLEKAITARSQKELVESIEEAESTGLLTRKQDRSLLARARVILNIIVARKEMAKQRHAMDQGPSTGFSFEDTVNAASAA
mmetsp:Transcript_100405/g.199245  ORF Transcript_100405/g.199245 Transcript_100405/m.199245 type:complete len:248 (+) Transcript_100405:40-783(+)